jgi:hypothetical protein
MMGDVGAVAQARGAGYQSRSMRTRKVAMLESSVYFDKELFAVQEKGNPYARDAVMQRFCMPEVPA